VLQVLSEGGRDDVAFRLLLQLSYPSWLYEVQQGATTVWERWNGDHGDPTSNSQSHYALGAVGEWLYRYLAGIDEAPGSVGFSRIEIRPRWPAPLDSLRAEYRSPRGAIVSTWRRLHGGSVEVTVEIPANTTGRVFLPAERPAAVQGNGAQREASEGQRAVFVIASGTYRFIVPQ